MQPARQAAALFLLALTVIPVRPTPAAEGSPAPEDIAFFEAKVRPILVEHCDQCHSSRSKRLRGGLRLDSREGWTKGGDTGPAIVPGDPDQSLLIEAVRYADEDLKMPPKGKLPDAAIAVLVEWVKRGAPDPRTGAAAIPAPRKTVDLDAGREFWSFRPLAHPEPPPVRDESWCRTPIDRFILAGLEAKGLAPNPQADRRTLIRRAYYDLTGLPPTPEEVDALVQDPSPRAYDRLIDRLLESPRYGERWARHWLDLARFAESHGFEHDYDRPSAYHYRDFVIEALNRDLPYDTFVRWQLAGDELAPEDNLALKATGFLAAGVHSTQITANQVEKERYDELDDMANTMGTAFLGLTIGCARCHDHKFDPIPQSDYYRLLATFTTTVRSEIDLLPDPKGYAKARKEYEEEHAPYVAALSAFEAQQLPARLAQWEQSRSARSSSEPQWVVLDPTKTESKGGVTFTRHDDGSLQVGGKNPDRDTYTITAACDLEELTAIRVEALSDAALVRGGPGRADDGNFDLTGLKLTIGPRYGIGTTTSATLINPEATFEENRRPIAAAIDDDPRSGWSVAPRLGADHAAIFELGSDVHLNGGATLTFTLEFQGKPRHAIGRLRLSVTSSPRPVGLDGDGVPPNLRPILAIPREERTAAQTKELLAWYKTIDLEWRALAKAIEDHARTAPKANGVKCLISTEGLPAVRLHTQGADFLPSTHFLKRGDPNQKQGEATQGFLQVLERSPDMEKHWQVAPPKGWRTSYRRASLANWITDVDEGAGHLLARVIVNRLWQHHLGRGIVATSSDFGAQGQRPSHPELLDWLANELIRNGWRLKQIHALIMTSAVYRQSSAPDPTRAAADPENALWGRWSPRRLEAEAIRDTLLSVGGLLDLRMYGPGTLDETMNRRSIYFTVKRSKLIPMMVLFDAPDALQPIAVRASTTIAPQSLLLMNSPVVREWAAGFARRVTPPPGGSLDDAVRSAYRIALGRLPDPAEQEAARAFVARQVEAYRATGQADPQRMAPTDFCQTVMSLNELIFIE